MKTHSITCVDLFSGSGGLSLGLHQAGFRCVQAVEFNTDAAATYVTNFKSTDVRCADIRTIDWAGLVGKINLVAGGPPCQPFSVAGKQRAHQDPRDMLPEFVRAIHDLRPRAFLMENVAALAGIRHLSYLNIWLDRLRSYGYCIQQAVLDAADFGVPQHRKRLIVLGGLNFMPVLPEPTHGLETSPYKTAGQALRDAPRDIPNQAAVVYAKHPILRASSYAGMLVNGGGRPINLGKPSPTIPATAGGNRTHIVDREHVLETYHAHLMAGERPRQGVVMGVRRLTVAESARLQAFPDTFRFTGSRSSRYHQIGNAVPPPLAAAVGRALMDVLTSQR